MVNPAAPRGGQAVSAGRAQGLTGKGNGQLRLGSLEQGRLWVSG